MKLHIMSDIHLEIASYQATKTDADVVVLAGDIGKGSQGLEWARGQWPHTPIVYVTGNHEFYGAQRAQMLAEMRLVARKLGIHFLENNEVVIDDVRFLGTTLWTDFMLFGPNRVGDCMVDAQCYLSDFRVIQEGSKGHFAPVYALDLFKDASAWLLSRLREDKGVSKTVVVTHHLPSRQSVSKIYEDQLLSACFASDFSHALIGADLWVHGHAHDSFDYVENGCRVVCNPRGYETYNGIENYVFDPKLVVEI
jgi:hypothetical protein